MSSSKKSSRKREKKMDNKNSCPVKCPMGGFCWKSPVHWFFGLAVLPFTIEGVKVVWAALKSLAG